MVRHPGFRVLSLLFLLGAALSTFPAHAGEPVRLVFAAGPAGGLLLIKPGWITDLMGAGLILVGSVLVRRQGTAVGPARHAAVLPGNPEGQG